VEPVKIDISELGQKHTVNDFREVPVLNVRDIEEVVYSFKSVDGKITGNIGYTTDKRSIGKLAPKYWTIIEIDGFTQNDRKEYNSLKTAVDRNYSTIYKALIIPIIKMPIKLLLNFPIKY